MAVAKSARGRTIRPGYPVRTVDYVASAVAQERREHARDGVWRNWLVSTMTKVFIGLVSVLAFVLSSLAVASAARWSNAREQIADYQQLYQSELVRRQNIEGQMAVSLAMKDEALKQERQLRMGREAQVSELTDKLAARNIDLARETNDRVAAEAGRKKLEEILDAQNREMTSMRKQDQELLREKIDLQTRNQRLGSRVLELTSQVTIQTDEIRNLQEKLYAAEQALARAQQGLGGTRRGTPTAEETPTGVVAAKPAVAGPIQGEIVEVDGRYVSINVGETSGVVPGMPFMVHRGGRYVADVHIESVQPKQAGGKVTLLKPGEQVRQGDRVSYGMD